VEAHLLLLQRLKVAESERRETWRETEEKFESAKAERRETKELLEEMQKTLQELQKTPGPTPGPTPAPTPPEGTCTSSKPNKKEWCRKKCNNPRKGCHSNCPKQCSMGTCACKPRRRLTVVANDEEIVMI